MRETDGSKDPWGIDRLDLDGYLRRLGITARTPSRAALDELHEAHVRTFTFDNIDVLLGQHPGVGLEAVGAKFVDRGRGGYCFEHATVFAAALARLGYRVERRLARVGDVREKARTHCVVFVRMDDTDVLADLGFGLSLLRPIPLVNGAEDEHGGWAYRLDALDGDGEGPGPRWQLSRLRDGAWEVMHTTDPLPVRPVDLVMGHHFTSTFEGSQFVRGLMLTAHQPGQHTTVTHETITVRRPGAQTEHRPLHAGELEELVATLAPAVTDEERDRLLARVATLPRA